MKAININGEIRVFTDLPVDWKNYLNFKEAGIELQQSEGFFDLVEPVINETVQVKGEVYFDNVTKVFTYRVMEKVLPALQEAKSLKLAELKRAVKELYATVQWIVESYRMEETTIPTAIKDKIRLIKTRYEQARNQINAITSVVDVLKWQVPYEAINNLKNDLEQLG
jgi:hypothetical protein